MGGTSADSDCGCKLGRVAGDRNLGLTLERIETAWREQDASLRNLERVFNQTVLEAALETEGYVPLDGEVDNLYRLLTDDDVTGGMRMQARNRLKDQGLDIDTVKADFVSYQTINRHLKECCGITNPTEVTDISLSEAENRLFALRTRAVEVTRQTVGQLNRTDAVDVGEFDVNVDIGVTCVECGAQADLVELCTGWRCDCHK